MPGSDCVPYNDVSISDEPNVAWFKIITGDILVTSFYSGFLILHTIKGIEIVSILIENRYGTAYDVFPISSDSVGIISNTSQKSYIYVIDLNEPQTVPNVFLCDSPLRAVMAISPGVFVTSHINKEVIAWSWQHKELTKIASIESKNKYPIHTFYPISANKFLSSSPELILWEWNQNQLTMKAFDEHRTWTVQDASQLASNHLMTVSGDSIQVWDTQLKSTVKYSFEPVNNYVGRQAYFSSFAGLTDGGAVVVIGHKPMNEVAGGVYDTDIVLFHPENKQIQPEFIEVGKGTDSIHYKDGLLALPDGNFAAYDTNKLLIYKRTENGCVLFNKYSVYKNSFFGVASNGYIINCGRTYGYFTVYPTPAVEYPSSITQLLLDQGLTKNTTSIVTGYLGFFNSKEAKLRQDGNNRKMEPESNCVIL